MRPLNGYFFEDYRVGQQFTHATPRTITAGDAAHLVDRGYLNRQRS